jgi:NACHT domain-containing protein
MKSLWGIIGGALSLVLALISWGSKPKSAGPAQSTDTALENLASAVAAQWRDEAEFRGVSRSSLIPVHWSLISRPPTVNATSPARGSAVTTETRWRRTAGTLTEAGPAYRGIPSGRLVILGAPGAGKTVFTIVLALDLLRERKPADPVPVVLSVASWNPERVHLHAWLAAQLEADYVWLRLPSPVPDLSLASWLTRTNRIVPILDGLDEMGDDLPGIAIEALNRMVTPGDRDANSVIITCRSAEYRRVIESSSRSHAGDEEELLSLLDDAGVMELQPLGVDELRAYLSPSAGGGRGAGRWQGVIAAVERDHDGGLARALATPLIAALARSAYANPSSSPEQLTDPGLGDRGQIEIHLLDQLIPTAYGGPPLPVGGRPSDGLEQVRPRFVYLARHLQRAHRTAIAWWDLGSVMPGYLYWLAFGLGTGLVGGVAFGILAGPLRGLLTGLGIALAAQAVGRVSSVNLPAVVSFRLRTGVERFTRGFAIGLMVGFAVEFALGLPVSAAITSGGAVGLVGGLAAGFAFVLEHPPTTPRASEPRTILRGDKMAFLVRTLLIGPLGGVAAGLAIGLNPDSGVQGPLRPGLVVAMALALGATVVISARIGIVGGVLAGCALGAFGGVTSYLALTGGNASTGVVAVTVGVCLWSEIALALAFTSAWGRYCAGCLWGAVVGPLPWRLMRFLEDARRRGVLRRAGPVYEFRHVALQEHLADGPGTIAPAGRAGG